MSVFWQWFFGIIGGIAFIMAIQPFTQVILGKPCLFADFETQKVDTKLFLVCKFWNSPIRNKIMQMLLITRNPVEDLYIEFEIFNKQKMQSIGNTFTAKIKNQEGTIVNRTTLKASIQPISIPIIVFNESTSSTYILNESKDNMINLQNGIYIVKIITYFADMKKMFKNEFLIKDDKPQILIGI
jgi:hypothetical protein